MVWVKGWGTLMERGRGRGRERDGARKREKGEESKNKGCFVLSDWQHFPMAGVLLAMMYQWRCFS